MTDFNCRVCGCSDDAACVLCATPCFWVEGDLCSGCASLTEIMESEAGRLWLDAFARDYLDHRADGGGATVIQGGAYDYGIEHGATE